jgi:prolipoprotein diacylglyceryltransferase
MNIKNINIFYWLTVPYHWLNRYPVMFKGKGFHIVNFGFFSALDGMLIMMMTIYYLHITGVAITQSFAYVLILGVILVWSGAKVFHFIALGKKFWESPLKYIFQTGFYVQGGIAGAIIFGLSIRLTTDISAFVILDGLAWGTLLGQYIGRLGCFNYGCCFGKSTNKEWGITYNNHHSKIIRVRPELNNVHIHPSQLYTANLHLVAFIITTFLITLPLPSGFLGAGFLVYHGLSRIFLEQFREDIIVKEKRDWFTGNVALLMIVSGILYFAIGFFFIEGWMPPDPLVYTPGIMNFFTYYITHPYLFIVLAVTGILTFIGYGIHGEVLGTFPMANEK